jgi:hypothetical protein
MEENYKVEDFEDYTFDKWYYKLKDIEMYNIKNEHYQFIKESILIEFDKLEIIYFLHNKAFSNNMKYIINSKLNFTQDYFFKLSNRSPKDILEYNPELCINDEDHRTIKTEKKIKQLEILKVNSIEKIEYLLNNSNRCEDDMQLFSIYNGNSKLYLVFQEWKPNLGKSIEYRCFVNNSKLSGICLFKPEYYSSRTIIPVEILNKFCDKIIEKLELKKYIIDCFIYNDDKYNVHFIEINPFDEHTDTFSFDYDNIMNTDTLLVTL